MVLHFRIHEPHNALCFDHQAPHAVLTVHTVNSKTPIRTLDVAHDIKRVDNDLVNPFSTAMEYYCTVCTTPHLIE